MTPGYYRIIGCGSRDWIDGHRVFYELQWITSWLGHTRVTVVHGGARGADAIIGRAAERLGCEVEVHLAEWEAHGRSAGHIRNRKMAGLGAHLCLAFWDGKSPGTLGMIQEATRHKIPVRIVPQEHYEPSSTLAA